MEIQRQGLSNLQLELLKLYSGNVSDEDILAIKKLLAAYFAQKAEQEFERFWDEKGLQPDDMRQWAREQHRLRQ